MHPVDYKDTLWFQWLKWEKVSYILSYVYVLHTLFSQRYMQPYCAQESLERWGRGHRSSPAQRHSSVSLSFSIPLASSSSFILCLALSCFRSFLILPLGGALALGTCSRSCRPGTGASCPPALFFLCPFPWVPAFFSWLWEARVLKGSLEEPEEHWL